MYIHILHVVLAMGNNRQTLAISIDHDSDVYVKYANLA